MSYYPSAAGYGNLPNAAWVPTIYSQKVLKKFRKINVAHQVTNTDYAGEISDYGDSVRIISEPDVAVSTYVRGSQVTPTDLIDVDQVMTVDQGNYFAFKVDDVEKAQSHINWESLAADRAAYALNNAFDQNIFSYMSTNFTTNTIGTTSAPAVVTLSPSSAQYSPLGIMNRALKQLQLQNVPMDDLWFVADPQFWELMNDENSKIMPVNYTGADKSPVEDGIFDGRVISWKLRGFDCFLSNNLPSVGTGPSGSTSSNYGYLFAGHKSAAATATQIVKVESFRDPDSFADVVRGLNVFGRKVLRPEAGVAIVYNRAGV